LATSKLRFNRQEILQVFLFCAFPVHLWAFINMFVDVPAWLMYMNLWELTSAIAYTLTFALVETTLLFLGFMLLGHLIPRSWTSEPFVSLACVLAIELALLAAGIQALIVQDRPKLLALVGAVLVVAATVAWVWRTPKLRGLLRVVADRIALLTYFYLSFDLVGAAIVLFRNVKG
jgi:hypothetical protein